MIILEKVLQHYTATLVKEGLRERLFECLKRTGRDNATTACIEVGTDCFGIGAKKATFEIARNYTNSSLQTA